MNKNQSLFVLLCAVLLYSCGLESDKKRLSERYETIRNRFAQSDPIKIDAKGTFVYEDSSTDATIFVLGEDTLIRDTNFTSEFVDDIFYVRIALHPNEQITSIHKVPNASNPNFTEVLLIDVDDLGPVDVSQIRYETIIVGYGIVPNGSNLHLQVVKPSGKERKGSTTYNDARDKEEAIVKSLEVIPCMFNCTNPNPSGCDRLIESNNQFGIELSAIGPYDYTESIDANGDVTITITESPQGTKVGCCLIPTPPISNDPTITLVVKPTVGKTRKGSVKYSDASTPVDFPCN